MRPVLSRNDGHNAIYKANKNVNFELAVNNRVFEAKYTVIYLPYN